MQVARLTQWSNLLLKNINIDGVFVVGRTIKAGSTISQLVTFNSKPSFLSSFSLSYLFYFKRCNNCSLVSIEAAEDSISVTKGHAAY